MGPGEPGPPRGLPGGWRPVSSTPCCSVREREAGVDLFRFRGRRPPRGESPLAGPHAASRRRFLLGPHLHPPTLHPPQSHAAPTGPHCAWPSSTRDSDRGRHRPRAGCILQHLETVAGQGPERAAARDSQRSRELNRKHWSGRRPAFQNDLRRSQKPSRGHRRCPPQSPPPGMSGSGWWALGERL